MNIWIIEIGEPLPMEPDARLLRYGRLTKELSRFGHEIVWWTSSFSHAQKKHYSLPGDKQTVDGVCLQIIDGPGYKKNVSYQRIRHQRHFAIQFGKAVDKQKTPDLVICSIPTIENALVAVSFARRRNIPVLIDIRDEWPDELVDLAPSFLRGIARLLFHHYYRQMRFVCKKATGIIAVSQSFLNYGLSFAERGRSFSDAVIPLGYAADQLEISKLEQARAWWIAKGIREDNFICCFFGTIGNFFNLETIIRGADILSKEIPLQFVLCGNGSSLIRYEKLASGTQSVIFPGWVDQPRIASLMDIASVGLAPYAANARMSLPNKPFEYFAGGLPVVSSIQGELKQILHQYKCGLTYQANSVNEFCDCIRLLYHDDTLRREMGRRAGNLLLKEFSLDVIAKKYNQHMIEVVNNFR